MSSSERSPKDCATGFWDQSHFTKTFKHERGGGRRLEEVGGGFFSSEGNLRDRPHERPIFQGFCVSPRRLRSWRHCQQLGNFLRVAGGVGRDATAEAVDGRAKAMQLRDKGHA